MAGETSLGDPVALEEILTQPLWENHLVGNKKMKYDCKEVSNLSQILWTKMETF